MSDTMVQNSASANPIDQAYRIARKRVRALRGWYLHALVYASVVGGMWVFFLAQGATALSRNGCPSRCRSRSLGPGSADSRFCRVDQNQSVGRNWEARKIEQFMREEREAGARSRG